MGQGTDEVTPWDAISKIQTQENSTGQITTKVARNTKTGTHRIQDLKATSIYQKLWFYLDPNSNKQ